MPAGHPAQTGTPRRYDRGRLADAVAEARTWADLMRREVAAELGAPPATGTLSHIARRIAAAGIDISHFPGMNRAQIDLPFTTAELAAASASADSVRGVARLLGVPDDSRSRAAHVRPATCPLLWPVAGGRC
ncbi:hypothetical protein [Streptomyces scopuliridis]|uniref:hypothetical protein n=1 Tax=Streptomyces scopuliridis TaxID=452529 RepID=UPI00367E7D32